MINAAKGGTKGVSDPNAYYDSLLPLWLKSRAFCSGQEFVKALDSVLDVNTFTNLLIPFSPSMTPEQYEFYKAEAELPGITAQFSKMLVGGLLRKKPVITFPDGITEDAKDWINNSIAEGDSSLISFLYDAIWEEVQTSRSWLMADYPRVENSENLTTSEMQAYKPYIYTLKAETIINWQTTQRDGEYVLSKLLIKGSQETYEDGEFHPIVTELVYVHELDESGNYRIRVFKESVSSNNLSITAGHRLPSRNGKTFELYDTIEDILVNGERMKMIPAWPLNGKIAPREPMLMAIINKEVALYNKLSRRNHLLYGAATYTPIICSDMLDEDFDAIVAGGLGSWIRLRQGDTATVLETPTDALKDMDRAIEKSIEEIAKLGIRMLSPEAAQSGVALEIRNANQTAMLGNLNTTISDTMQQVIAFMLNWRYDLDVNSADITFKLSDDFNPAPLGADWLRLVYEWYQNGHLPRTAWLRILKQNDILEAEYDDVIGQGEIAGDDTLMPKMEDEEKDIN